MSEDKQIDEFLDKMKEMKEQNITVTESGLKCDNPSCDWTGPDIRFPEYREWVNKPCPKCGENVLTMDDYERAEVLRMSIDIANSMTDEDMEAISALFSCEDAKKSDMFKDAKGLEHLDCEGDKKVHITMTTHNEIKVTEINS